MGWWCCNKCYQLFSFQASLQKNWLVHVFRGEWIPSAYSLRRQNGRDKNSWETGWRATTWNMNIERKELVIEKTDREERPGPAWKGRTFEREFSGGWLWQQLIDSCQNDKTIVLDWCKWAGEIFMHDVFKQHVVNPLHHPFHLTAFSTNVNQLL